ncbi:MAG: NAD(P)H-binding protein [Pseudolysinimonas sp.]
MNILVTGGTGGLGRPTVAALRSSGHQVRVLSRRPADGRVVGDLRTGSGLAAALNGIDTVVHCATNRRKDTPGTGRLLDAARAAGVSHVVFISIVGADDNPYPYYRDKVVTEKLIADSGIPFTILRATQFHDFVAMFLRPQRRLPFITVLDLEDQPIAVEEVAARLAELAAAPPAGRVADIGGPERLHLRTLAEQWQTAHGTHKKIRMLPLGGATVRAFRRGNHMTALPGYGTRTFADYAAADARSEA